MSSGKDILLGRLRSGDSLSRGQQLRLTLMLAVPAILAQLSSVLMQYIDSAMVGRLGANPAASIGLVASCTWLFNGFSLAVITGFSVQVAHACGAKEFDRARLLLRQGLFVVTLFSAALGLVGMLISGPLPGWLGGAEELRRDASAYFCIYAAFLPVSLAGWGASAMLQSSGNMKVPSIMYIGMCALDVVFNYIFIYVLDMGVVGAAWGTGIAESITSLLAIWYAATRSPELRQKGVRGSFVPSASIRNKALSVTGPLWIQNVVMRGAYVASTLIVAPLGPVSIAANAFKDSTSITSATIPSSVTSIGQGAFSGCSSLETMTIPFVGAEAGKTENDTYQYPFGYIFGTASYTGGTSTSQYYYGTSTTSRTSQRCSRRDTDRYHSRSCPLLPPQRG